MGASDEPIVFRHHGLLGTVIEVRVEATSLAGAEHVDALVIAEVERLQAVFNARDESSELRRWARGEVEPSAELAEVVALADRWTERSGGAFDARAGALFQIWSDAADAGHVPDANVLQRQVERSARARDEGLRTGIDLSGIAKGWIVDRAAALAFAVDGVTSVAVNAGGDLVHAGAGSVTVGIEDPRRRFDNAPPLVAIRLGASAVATSGGARRGWRIDGTWFPQVLDPRTGWPVDAVASASVVAPTAAVADVVATVLAVLGPVEGIAFVDEGSQDLAGVEGLVVCADGTLVRSRGWADLEIR